MKRLGTQTIQFDNPPTIISTASIVGPKEAQGPLAKYFDQCLDDEFWVLLQLTLTIALLEIY